jgi:WD40 repeat protein
MGLISSGGDAALAWDLETGSVTAEYEQRAVFDAYGLVQFTDDGSTVVAATFNGDVALHDPETLDVLRTRGADRPGIALDICARSTEDVLVAMFTQSKDEHGGSEVTVAVSEVTTPHAVFEGTVEWAHVADGDLSGNGRHFAIVGVNRSRPQVISQAIVWDLAEGRHISTVESERSFRQVVLSHDGSRMATLDLDGIDVWDTTTGERERGLGVGSAAHDAQMVASAELSTIVVTTATGAQIFDGHTGLLRQNVDGHSLPVSSVALSPDAGMIATGSEDQTIKLWATGR